MHNFNYTLLILISGLFLRFCSMHQTLAKFIFYSSDAQFELYIVDINFGTILVCLLHTSDFGIAYNVKFMTLRIILRCSQDSETFW